ncbi:MAG: hypothetical protein JSS83_12335 [Cyanobacteria bacterium SZAS LIN-3]|nr:hypothetical protein [Cyanobacteria bacterium SZAS LIN-3]
MCQFDVFLFSHFDAFGELPLRLARLAAVMPDWRCRRTGRSWVYADVTSEAGSAGGCLDEKMEEERTITPSKLQRAIAAPRRLRKGKDEAQKYCRLPFGVAVAPN